MGITKYLRPGALAAGADQELAGVLLAGLRERLIDAVGGNLNDRLMGCVTDADGEHARRGSVVGINDDGRLRLRKGLEKLNHLGHAAVPDPVGVTSTVVVDNAKNHAGQVGVLAAKADAPVYTGVEDLAIVALGEVLDEADLLSGHVMKNDRKGIPCQAS